VGAVSVLFLFVIMLLNLRIVEIYNTFINYLPLGLFIGIFFFLELLFILFKDLSFFTTISIYDNFFITNLEYKNNLTLIAELLYNYYLFYLIIASLILLLGMIGVIALTVDFYKKRKIIKSKKVNIINKKIIF
jgi:NADH-quinone oxidoreductase subunit J